ncbi:hypothetical protein VNO80_28865 [Phaseolus coccineus]|uniref:Uncharacterized protein n=1 Tax=Phaseolus coccineus TaxID=3886 RepID=A0AAN9QEE1_PHACN
MAIKTKALLVLSLLLLVATCMQYCVNGEQQVPCFFIFGDSLSDNGNNNNLQTQAKSNYNPYGIDFPNGPTGRFSNGRVTVDYLAEFLGFEESVPPYANTSGSDILKGVNYASGAAGILSESGKHLGDNIHLEKQLRNHRVIYSKIVKKLGGSKKAKEYLNKCLYYVNIGSNDFINNFFLPQLYSSSRTFTLERYTNLLIKKLSENIEELHESGARKVVLVGLGALGCIPRFAMNGSCVDEFNEAAFVFSNKLNSQVNTFNYKFPDSNFNFINSSDALDLGQFGFTVLDTPCCPTRDDGQCVPNGTPCQNRNEYVFYDEFHITEAVHRLIAIGSYNQIKPLIQH